MAAEATANGLDRVVFFTDAVVAIAITLLILPLVDEVPAAAADRLTVAEFIQKNSSQFLGFVISFAVTARLWVAHNSVFRHVQAHTPALVTLNLLWAFTIAVLPLPTAMVSQFVVDPAAVAFYIGTMALSSGVLSLILLMVMRNPTLANPANPFTIRDATQSLVSFSLFLLALAVGVTVPAVQLWSLLLLFLTGPFEWAASRWLARR